MSFLKKLFGGGVGGATEPDAPTETYEGFRITAKPVEQSGEYRVAPVIPKHKVRARRR